MEYVLALALPATVVGIGWLIVVWFRPTPEPPRQVATATRQPPKPERAPRPATKDELIIDLRDLESTRMRVKGTSHYIPDAQRRYAGSREYRLVREPDNSHDSEAVAVIATDGRKVGYVSANRGALMAPLLDQIPADGYLVTGVSASEHSTALRVDLPLIPELREFVKARTAIS